MILHIQCLKHVIRRSHRKIRRIRIVWGSMVVGRMDVREPAQVMLREPVCGRFRGRRLQIEQLRRVFLLVIRQTLPHMLQHPLYKRLALWMGQIMAEPPCVQAHLIAAADSDR